jgi:rod shape determining protein RodA
MPRLLRIIIGSDLAWAHSAWLCVLSALALSVLGIYAIDLGTNPVPAAGLVTPTGIVLRQIIFLCVGLLASALVALPHYRWLRWLAWPSIVVCIGLLVFLLLPLVPSWLVTPRNGARCWIQLGPIDFQPGEVAKIAFVLVLAAYLRHRENHRTFAGLLPPAIIAFVPAALITLQPDLGMATLFAPTLLAMLLVAGAKLKHLIIVVLLAMTAAPAAYPLLRPHQRARIDGLLARIQGSSTGAESLNYQALTAQTLAGAGQLSGVSDAKARALVRFNRLPEQHNDMILAVIMTRFGFIGAVIVLALYLLWLIGAYCAAALCKDPFGRLVIVGFMAIIFAQTFVNVGMNVGVMPIVGLTLPFVSYGGSSLVTVWLMTGLVFSIAMRRPARLVRPAFEFDAQPYDPLRGALGHRVAPSRRS